MGSLSTLDLPSANDICDLPWRNIILPSLDESRKILTGEVICPKCHSGNLCYLISDNKFISIECSTNGCVHGDGPVM